MSKELLTKIKSYFYDTLITTIGNEDFNRIQTSIDKIFPEEVGYLSENKKYSVEELIILLSKINEKEVIRKKKGVYYTPQDITDFIVKYTSKLYAQQNCFEKLFTNSTNTTIGDKSFFDPTCGAGEFLLSVLKLKYDENHDWVKSLETIYGNDINPISICITKIRLILTILKIENNVNLIKIVEILNNNFYCVDYISDYKNIEKTFDIIIGNPPYVEDSKSKLDLQEKYGNIYANVLVNSAQQIKEQGCYAFIIPISYISTPRMKKLRKAINELFKVQYILSYADRPGCLFQGVHQKLCILIAKRINLEEKKLYTNSYTYWYQDERNNLFNYINIVENKFENEKYIPKLSNKTDKEIYEKVISLKKQLCDLFVKEKNQNNIYLNMRAAFWIKAFLTQHNGNDYTEYSFANPESKYYFYCLINSSLFWYFWICISDCWHITWKELENFKIPDIYNVNKVKELAINLENALENTKEYIGTKQVDYEYKHKNCLKEITEIDDYINNLFNLNENESNYIKTYALKYRTGNMVYE